MAPRSCSELFWTFNALALQGFGGVMGVAQRELVERRGWMSPAEFVQETALAQALPGPNVCNLALALGDRYFGWRGALSAFSGLMVVPLLLLVGLVLLYGAWAHHPAVAAALWGMGGVTGGIIAGTGLKLLPTLREHPLSAGVAYGLVVMAFVALAWLRWPIASVILGLGGLSVLLTWWRLRRQAIAAAKREAP